MFGGDSSNPVNPLFTGDNQFQYDTNALPQLQLFADYTVGSSLGPLSNTGKDHTPTPNMGTKRFMEPDTLTRQQKHISQDNKLFQNEIGQSGRILNPNLVSTGLKLSYEEDEHNSSISSVSEGMTTTLPAVLPSNNSLKAEIDRQKQELDQYIRLQEENMIKGIRDLHQRQTTSFLTAIEKGLSRKLHEKDYEIENMNRKNRDLEEKIKHAMTEVQTWQVRAKYNESVVNILKNNLQQVMAQNGKEGCGDSEVEDTASCNNQNQNQNHVSFMDGSSANPNLGKVKRVCRACKVNEVSVLVLPCRHLCVCRDCERFVHVCPVCQVMKTASVEVYMS